MFKRIVILVGIMFNAAAMDNQQSYGRDINKIEVSTLTKPPFTVPVNDTTTAFDVKTYLRTSEGIPVEHQNLQATWPTWRLTLKGWTNDHSACLLDDCKIKEVMALYRTDKFRLFLKLPPVQSTQNHDN